MNRNSWEYRCDGKVYKVESLTVLNSDPKHYIINREPSKDSSKCGSWVKINDNNYIFVWNIAI